MDRPPEGTSPLRARLAAGLALLAVAAVPTAAEPPVREGEQARPQPPVAAGPGPPAPADPPIETPDGHRAYDPEEVLAKMRRAVGYERLAAAGGVAIEGVALEGGEGEGRVESSFALRAGTGGAFLLRQDGLTGETTWYDGTAGFAVDWNGWRQPAGPWDVHRGQLLAALRTGLWLDPESPFAIVGVRPREGLLLPPGRVMLLLRRRDAPLTATVFVREADWLPELARYRAGLGIDAELRFLSWERHGGVLLPATVERTAGTTVRWRLESAALGAADPGPAPEPGGRGVAVRFDPETPARLAVRRVPGGPLLVRPTVAGEDVGWFLLDSASPITFIDPAVRRRLGLEPLGHTLLRSLLGEATGAIVRLPSLAVGPLRLEGLRVTELETAPLTSFLDTEVAGVLGYDLFAAAVVEVSGATPSVAVHDPATYPGDGLPWKPLAIHAGQPLARGGLPTGRALFRIDLGAGQVGAGLILDAAASSAAAGHPGWKPLRRARAGQVDLLMGRLPWFELEGFTFTEPLVALVADPGETFLRDDYTAGLVGSGFLAAFDLVFDYPRARIAFRPHPGAVRQGAPEEPPETAPRPAPPTR